MSIINYDKKAIGARIRNIRLNKGMTLEEFGSLFNASKSIVYRWENGTSIPNAERFKAISKIGDISIENLLYGTIKERISKILYSFFENDNRLSNIDIKSLTRSIYHSLPTTDITNQDLEFFIKNYLDNLVLNASTHDLTNKDKLKKLIDDLNDEQIQELIKIINSFNHKK